GTERRMDGGDRPRRPARLALGRARGGVRRGSAAARGVPLVRTVSPRGHRLGWPSGGGRRAPHPGGGAWGATRGGGRRWRRAPARGGRPAVEGHARARPPRRGAAAARARRRARERHRERRVGLPGSRPLRRLALEPHGAPARVPAAEPPAALTTLVLVALG